MTVARPDITLAPEEFVRDARQRWDRGAPGYDAHRARSRSPWYLTLERRVHRDLLVPPDSRPRLLDAGCGTGELSSYLAAYADVVAVDLSPVSVSLLHRRSPEVPALVGDLAHLPLKPGTFDGAVANIVLSHMPDPMIEATLRNLHAALKPGGVLVFTLFHWDAVRHFRRAFPRPRGRFASGVYYRAFTIEEAAELMAGSPFVDVEVRALGLLHAVCHPRRLVHRLYYHLGWLVVPLERLIHHRWGLLARTGTYVLVVARKLPVAEAAAPRPPRHGAAAGLGRRVEPERPAAAAQGAGAAA